MESSKLVANVNTNLHSNDNHKLDEQQTIRTTENDTSTNQRSSSHSGMYSIHCIHCIDSIGHSMNFLCGCYLFLV